MPSQLTSLAEALTEILSAYVRELQLCFLLLLLWAAIFRGLVSFPVRRAFAAASPRVRSVILALGVTAALLWAWHLISLFDDAYISLRYAQNLVRGRGLVFNVGDRVEGYTNFLWTMLFAGAMAVQLDGPRFAIAACLVCFALELLLLVRVSRQLHGERGSIPFAAILFGASYTCATFGTSGMETMLCAVLLTLMLEQALREHPGRAGLCGILGVLTHPDFALFYVGLGIVLALRRAGWRALLRYGAAFLFLYVPCFLWRWRYYGDFLPNTYFAKSANLPYYRQGVVYLAASLLGSGAWALLPLACVALWRRPRHLLSAFCLFGALPYLVYVARIGGDFMLGRLLVPVLPLVALLAELGIRDLLPDAPAAPQWAAFLLPALAVLPVHLIGSFERKWNLSDERTWYRVVALSPDVTWEADNRTQVLLDLIAAGQHPVVAEVPVGREAYMTDLTIIDVVGLTDRTVAHQPLVSRGVPGHEKRATYQYLRSRNVALSVVRVVDIRYAAETAVRIRDQWFYLGRYEPGLVHAIQSLPDSDVPNVPAILDWFLDHPPIADRARLRKDATFFEEFYFAGTEDPARHARLQALLASSG